jgi:hypothetical protein
VVTTIVDWIDEPARLKAGSNFGIETMKGWIAQSYRAVAPETLSRHWTQSGNAAGFNECAPAPATSS